MHQLLIAVDSVGIDPQGHTRPDSIYSGSRFLFPAGRSGPVIPVDCGSWHGILVETEVADPESPGAIECALTYTSIFSGRSAIQEHGLMRGLGLRDRLLEGLIAESNLFRYFERSCLANAIFPAHLQFLGNSYTQDLIPTFDRTEIEGRLSFRGKPVAFRNADRHGFAELYTLAEINQNVFVYAAREAGVALLTWEDVLRGRALTSSLTHELEGEFDFGLFKQSILPRRTIEEAADVLIQLVREHDFTFYKYQIPDLVSHTGRIDLARAVFDTIERFVEAVLSRLDVDEAAVIVTSDHGHLEQVSTSRGHPKSKVPTWYFGPEASKTSERLRRPEGIFEALTGAGLSRNRK